MKTRTLTSEDREFLSLVSRAAFANPFGRDRLEIDRIIIRDTTDRPWAAIRPETIRQVAQRIAALDKQKTVTIGDYKMADARLIENAFLFDEYHKLNALFDEFIVQQANAQEKSLRVPFAKSAIDALVARGIAPAQAARYFALFYQIRRAFYFIHKGLIGQSPCMKKLREDLWNNIFTYNIDQYQRYLWDRMEDFSTLLLGPTGCGKGTAAAAIGKSGFIPYDEKTGSFARSFTETFVAANLSQFAETLLESELFGHARGAFTGAVDSHDGLFTLCGRYGSIFLDEIGDITHHVQLKLLKVLEERIFSPVGSHTRLRFHGRVIAATNLDVDELLRTGKFRSDFYYRLCSDCIHVPSLSRRIAEHPGELDELIAHTIASITGRDSDELMTIATDVIARQLGPDYPWPGNVRELAQCIRRIIIKRDYQPPRTDQPTLVSDLADADLSAADLLNNYCKILYKKHKTLEKVAQITRLDRRTVKKYISSPPS